MKHQIRSAVIVATALVVILLCALCGKRLSDILSLDSKHVLVEDWLLFGQEYTDDSWAKWIPFSSPRSIQVFDLKGETLVRHWAEILNGLGDLRECYFRDISDCDLFLGLIETKGIEVLSLSSCDTNLSFLSNEWDQLIELSVYGSRAKILRPKPAPKLQYLNIEYSDVDADLLLISDFPELKMIFVAPRNEVSFGQDHIKSLLELQNIEKVILLGEDLLPESVIGGLKEKHSQVSVAQGAGGKVTLSFE